MKITRMLQRLRPRRTAKMQALDVTAAWTLRDWADLPVHLRAAIKAPFYSHSRAVQRFP